jgi:hypothetical protein
MPAISLRLADPPSVVGTEGAHIGEKEPGAVAVELAAWVDVSGISPGNSKGAWEAVPPPEPPLPPPPDAPALPLPAVDIEDSDDPPACDPLDPDDEDAEEDTGTDPAVVLLLV